MSLLKQSKSSLGFLIPIVSILATQCAFAALEIHGFGGTGVNQTNNNYTIDGANNRGKKVTWDGRNVLGLNLSSDVTDKIDFFGQILAKPKGGSNKLAVDWMFLSYRPQNSLRFNLGRQMVSTWLYSEQIDVGLTYPWLAPPHRIYGLVPVKSFDGLSVSGSQDLWGQKFGLKVGAGGTALDVSIGSNNKQTGTLYVELQNILSAELKVEKEKLYLFRVGYVQGNLKLDGEGESAYNEFIDLTGTTVIASPYTPGITNRTYTVYDTAQAKFMSAGGKLNLYGFELISEVAHRAVQGKALTRITGAYATLAYGINRFKPHLTYQNLGSVSGSLLFHPGYPNVTSTLKRGETINGGLNYQLDPNVVIKGEYRTDWFTFSDPKTDITARTIAVGVDFVF